MVVTVQEALELNQLEQAIWFPYKNISNWFCSR